MPEASSPIGSPAPSATTPEGRQAGRALPFEDECHSCFDLFGISDIPAFLEESTKGHAVETQRGEYGDERDPKTRTFLAAISPAAHADRIRVPLMIFQGANDVRIKPQQSRAMVARIRAAGGRVPYIEAANEGHGLERAPNAFYVSAASLSFLERCLVR